MAGQASAPRAVAATDVAALHRSVLAVACLQAFNVDATACPLTVFAGAMRRLERASHAVAFDCIIEIAAHAKQLPLDAQEVERNAGFLHGPLTRR